MSACQACATACLQRGSLRTRVKEANAPANAQIYLSDALFLTHTRLRCLDIYLCWTYTYIPVLDIYLCWTYTCVPDTHTSQMLGHIPVFPGGGCAQQQLRHAAAQAASSASLAPKMKMDGGGGLQHFNSAAACMPQVGGGGFGLGFRFRVYLGFRV
jgi:hypothetical protein